MRLLNYGSIILFIFINLALTSCNDKGKQVTPEYTENKEKIASVKTTEVLAHWSQIIGNATSTLDTMPLKLMARFILKGSSQNCGDYKITGTSSTPPASAANKPSERSMSGQDPDFDITVCQCEMGVDWKSAALSTNSSNTVLATFPGPYEIGRKHQNEILALGFGDTGVRSDDTIQGKNWRFEGVVSDILNTAPELDFAIHVGDYRYFNEGSDPDSWLKWQRDFFDPAQPLLDKVPVAFSRGNHEQCAFTKDGQIKYWYGTRFFQFFEPTSSDVVSPCPENSASLISPWYFDVANKTGADPTLTQRIIMIDNSPDPDHFSASAIENAEAVNYTTALGLSTQMDSWWVMHKPIWENSNHYANKRTEKALYAEMAKNGCPSTQICNNGVCSPRAFMSGHSHMYQRISFNNKIWPVQYVFGHGGVRPLTNNPPVQSESNHKFDSPVSSCTDTYGSFDATYGQNGFLKLTRNANTLNTQSGWQIENCLIGSSCTVVSI